MREARLRRIGPPLVVGAILLVVGLGAAVGMVGWQRRHERRIGEAYGGLGRCLWGETLTEGQTPGARVHAGQLVQMAVPEEKRAATGETPWPERCATHAYALKERLVDAGRTEGLPRELAEAAVALGEALEDPQNLDAPLVSAVERVVELCERLQLKATAPSEPIPGPPAGPTPLTLDALETAGALSTKVLRFSSIVAEPLTDGVLRLILRDSERGPLLCTFGEAAACRVLPTFGQAASTLRFAGTVDEGTAPVVAGERDGVRSAWTSDKGEKLEPATVVGAWARKDGTVLWVDVDEVHESLHVTRRAAGGRVEDQIAFGGDAGKAEDNVGLLWGQLVWKAVNEGRVHLLARSLGAEGPLVGAQADVGVLSDPSLIENGVDEEPHVTGCKTQDAIVARVKGWSSQSLLFRSRGTWSAPQRVMGRGGAFTCRGAEATLTWGAEHLTGGAGAVLQARCTGSGCKLLSARGADLVGPMRERAPVGAAQAAAADLDGKLLLVWIAGAGGGLRMKLAPIDKVREAPDVVLFDPLIQKGKLRASSVLLEVRLFVRGLQSFVLVSTQAGVYAIRVGAEGAFAPVRVVKM